MAKPGHRRGLGFTLVELLVVIAVIGLLVAMLLPVLGKAQQAARATTCRSNLSQIYKGARLYANHYADLLPNLFAGLPFSGHVERYRKGHYAHSTDTGGQDVPAGLWLLYTGGQVEDQKVYFCPNVPGRRGVDGSENPTVRPPWLDGKPVPQMAGYLYNYFPDTGPTRAPLMPPPGDLPLDAVSNNINQLRDRGFSALMADLFLNSLEQPHQSRNGLNCCFWGGDVQWVPTDTISIPWNGKDGEAETFSDDAAGSLAVRDAWTAVSEHKK